MKPVQLREAKAKLSALVSAAERGEATTIKKNGKPAAVLVAVEQAARIPEEAKKPSFAEWLLSMPGELEIERDTTPIRGVEF